MTPIKRTEIGKRDMEKAPITKYSELNRNMLLNI